MSCDFCSLWLLPATRDLHEIVADVLAGHNVVFQRRGPALAVVDHREPARVVELLRHVLTETEKRDLMVAAEGDSGFTQRCSLDNWWRLRETSWFDEALAESRFSTWFQPVVDTACDAVIGYECLARLRQGTRNYGGVEIFDAAQLRREERSLDVHLRRLSIRRAAERDGSGVIFINFLPQAVYEPERCLADAMAAIEECGLDPLRVVFEAVGASDFEPAHLRGIADRVRERGCAFSLDDVGAGQEAVALIRDLRPNYVKLAASLTAHVESPAGATAVRRLAEQADRVRTIVVAKHVETTQTMENFWLLGVRFMQGYLFGRPAPAPAPPRLSLLNLAAAVDPEPAGLFEYAN